MVNEERLEIANLYPTLIQPYLTYKKNTNSLERTDFSIAEFRIFELQILFSNVCYATNSIPHHPKSRRLFPNRPHPLLHHAKEAEHSTPGHWAPLFVLIRAPS